MAKKEEVSYVRIDNANMIKLSLKQLAQLYADYAHIILYLKKINDKKMEIRKTLFSKLKDLESRYSVLMKDLPKLPKGVKIEKPAYPVEPIRDVEHDGEYDPFEGLRSEFANIRSELEKIR